MFLERLGVFNYDTNKYYKPKGTFNINAASADINLPNCTTYSFLRMQEAAECTERQKYWIRESGGYGNAKLWYDTTTLPKGEVPKVGSIAVFNGNCGHVAFVERVIDNTHVILSESNYNADKSLRDWHFFNLRKYVEVVVGKATLPGVGALIGFIYVPINDKRVDRDTTKDQVEITADYVNVRVEPSLSADLFSKGLYCPMGVFNVEEFKESDGYTWAKLDEDCWVACGDWSIIYKTEKKEEETEVDKLKAQVESLTKEVSSLKSKLNEIHTISNID